MMANLADCVAFLIYVRAERHSLPRRLYSQLGVKTFRLEGEPDAGSTIGDL